MNKKNGTKVFIGGIAPETTIDTVRSYFEMFGMISHCKIEVGKRQLIHKGYGYVTVPDIRVVNRIIGQDHHIDGKRIDVEIAKKKIRKEKPIEDNSEAIKKEEIHQTCPPLKQIKQLDRNIISFQGHMRKYFERSAGIQDKPRASKLSKFQDASGIQVQSKKKHSVPCQSIKAICIQQEDQEMISGSIKVQKKQNDLHDQELLTQNFKSSKVKNRSDSKSRRSSRITEVIRDLDHQIDGLRLKPNSSYSSKVRSSR